MKKLNKLKKSFADEYPYRVVKLYIHVVELKDYQL